MSCRSLKVAIIHAADLGGGAEACVLSLHRSLRAKGHDCNLYVGYRYLNEPGVKEIHRWRPFPGSLRAVRTIEDWTGLQNLYAPGLRRLVATLAEDHDLVHLHTLWGSGHYADLGSISLAAARFPTVLTLHDEWMMTGHCACSLGCQRWQTGCGKCPDLAIPPAARRDATRLNFIRKQRVVQGSQIHVTAVSNATRMQSERSPIFAGKPISVVYNGIDVATFSPGDRALARSRLGIPVQGFYALMAGQTIEGINQGIAQQAARALDRLNDRRITALLVGRSAAAVASTLSVPHRVLPFQGTPQAMADCYRAADLTLVSSEVETFGRIAAESQACGTPVITTDAGGLPEVVAHGVGGLVVPRKQVEPFAQALRQLAEDTQTRSRMQAAGVAWVRERFAEDRVAADYLAVYRQVIEERAAMAAM